MDMYWNKSTVFLPQPCSYYLLCACLALHCCHWQSSTLQSFFRCLSSSTFPCTIQWLPIGGKINTIFKVRTDFLGAFLLFQQNDFVRRQPKTKTKGYTVECWRYRRNRPVNNLQWCFSFISALGKLQDNVAPWFVDCPGLSYFQFTDSVCHQHGR